MKIDILSVLEEHGYRLYPASVRQIKSDAQLFIARRNGQKLIGLAGNYASLGLNDQADRLGSNACVTMYPLTWENYGKIAAAIPISPSPCNRAASFGTGDRLGMVTAAHLDADSKHPIFPVIAQQSPRELERTDRSFKSVLLDAVMGVLESGWSEPWGADADHIKDEARFLEGVEAGYSMYTLDVSEELRDISSLSASEIADAAESLNKTSKSVIKLWAGASITLPDSSKYVFDESELIKSALIYEKSMQLVERFNSIAKSRLNAYDLEVSIDEGTRDTSAEDHLFVADYLHKSGVEFKSLAPKFPGEFQKAVDYMGDLASIERAFNVHAQLARDLQGYRLSLHSGSDKFSVYKMFARATEGNLHIKTSGTSWLQAVNVVAQHSPDLFRELYALSRAALPESKKAYHVYITPEHFSDGMINAMTDVFSSPDVAQLFHISYGVLLEEHRAQIIETLLANELGHYENVATHISKHLKLLFE